VREGCVVDIRTMSTQLPPDLPGALREADPAVWRGDPEQAVIGTAGPRTDLFIDPAGSPPSLNAPRVLATVTDGDFQFSARVSVDFAATFDAGVLLVWVDDATWAKFCFEYSPQSEPTVVSVITRGESDDANFITVDSHTMWLRISRTMPSYALHASTDGSRWQFVRHLRLGEAADATVRIGLSVQSPTGEGCTATFDEIRFSPTRLADLRDGS